MDKQSGLARALLTGFSVITLAAMWFYRQPQDCTKPEFFITGSQYQCLPVLSKFLGGGH